MTDLPIHVIRFAERNGLLLAHETMPYATAIDTACGFAAKQGLTVTPEIEAQIAAAVERGEAGYHDGRVMAAVQVALTKRVDPYEMHVLAGRAAGHHLPAARVAKLVRQAASEFLAQQTRRRNA